MSDLVRTLKLCQLFELLPDAVAEPVLRRSRIRSYPRGSAVYSPADPGNCVMVLASGLVKIKSPAAPRADGAFAADGGRETTLAFVVKGELFGELALFGGDPRRDGAEAVEDTRVLILPTCDLLSLFEGQPDLALALARLIGRRRQRIETRHANLLFSPSRERVVRILHELADSHGDRSGNRVQIRLPLSHHDIAALIGVSRETATLALGELQAAGVVEMSRRRVVIADIRRLGPAAAGASVIPPLESAEGGLRVNAAE